MISKKLKKSIHLFLGLALGLFLLWIVFRDTNWAMVGKTIREVNLFWIAVCQAVFILSCFVRILRWRYIVRVAKPVSFRAMFSATQIGFLANFTLPGRAGEAVRAYMLSRLANLPFTKSMAMVALDRVNDLVCLLVVIVVSVLAFPTSGTVTIPGGTFPGMANDFEFSAEVLRVGALGTLAASIFIISCLAALYFWQAPFIRLTGRCLRLVSKKLADKALVLLQHFADGLHIFRSASDMAKSVFFSLLTWACFLIGTSAILEAFHFDWPWYAPFVMQFLLGVALSIPGAPGFIGQFHLPIVISLLLLIPNMELGAAKAFAILAHLLNVLPIAALGIISLLYEHVSVRTIAPDGLAEEDGKGARLVTDAPND